MKIIEREVPITEQQPAKSRRGYYRITDEFFRFWFKYVFPNRADLELGNSSVVLERIRATWPDHLGGVYEAVARELLWEHRDEIFPFSVSGRWWNNNEEIDLVALSPELDTILLAEVKWSHKPVGIDLVEKLKEKARKVAWGSPRRKEIYALFSKSGFTDAVLRMGESREVRLFKQETALLPKT